MKSVMYNIKCYFQNSEESFLSFTGATPSDFQIDLAI